MIDRLLDAVRGAFPDMADIVAGALHVQFKEILRPMMSDALRHQFLMLQMMPENGAPKCPTCNGTRCVPGEAYDPPNECPACQDREP